jgi:cellulose synthase/poly-beta-1,6-N-acetylglucosamine synthase-like glycosyltransferase
MSAALLATINYVMFLVFLGYFLILMAFYLLLIIIGFIEEAKRAWESRVENYPLIYFSSFNIPVSIIMPARNEEEWIRDSFMSLLNLNYPQYEIIVVDDGSTDRTLDIMKQIIDLKSIDMPYVKHYQDGVVREILKSQTHPHVTVISKSAGTKKAGAANAGLNIAKYDYVCVIDSDTVLEPDALLKTMAYVSRYSDEVIGIGSGFGLSNGLKIKDGRIIEHSASYNPIIAYQSLEYIRSFIGNRIGWSRYNAMPNVAGGFGIWRRDVLYEIGGYSPDFTCEDLEITFRVHDYIAKNREKNYRIVMLPYYIGWTEGPSDIGALISQRDRWQRVVDEAVADYKYMIFNPKYRGFAFLALPYYLLYEVWGVFFEITSIVLVVSGLIAGVLNLNTFLAFMSLMILSQALVSLLTLFAFIRGQKVYCLGYICYLVFLGALEFFFYRWIISLAKLLGTYHYLRRVRVYDQYARAKRKT